MNDYEHISLAFPGASRPERELYSTRRSGRKLQWKSAQIAYLDAIVRQDAFSIRTTQPEQHDRGRNFREKLMIRTDRALDDLALNVSRPNVYDRSDIWQELEPGFENLHVTPLHCRPVAASAYAREQ